MKVLILISCLLLVSIHTLTVGSCQQFSLDGQACLKCVDHFHLYEGTCYVDILGCQEYIFGNICHSCDNGYILVNNLCCDHNCLAKLFKRHDSTKAIKTINQNTKTFMKIIPFLNQNYIKGAIQNLVQIQFQDYIDVVRYVLLYEFPNGKFRMRRAVIDYVKDTQQLIMVDWSIVQDVSQFMNFHKDQIQLESDEQANKVIAKLFIQKPLISHIRKFKLTEIDQYQIVFNNLDKEQIVYQTFYLKDSKTIHLFTQFSAMPEFMPTQLTIYAADLASQININKSLKQAVRIVKLDSRYKDDIHHIIIKQKNRFVKQYMIHIQNSKEEMQFFLFENLKTNQIKIIDYIRKQKEVLKPIINDIVQNINVTEWNNNSQTDGITVNSNLSLAENKIVELLKNAVVNVKKEKKQQKGLSQHMKPHCNEQDKSDSKIQTEQISIVRLFRQKNPQIISFEIVQTWQHKFKTFKQWTFLVKNQTEKKVNYIYFHALQFLQNNTYTFWGQSTTTLSQINKEGLYQLINNQENVAQSKVKDARSVITDKYPQTQNLTARKNILRTFPQKNSRSTILLRHETSLIRYVVLSYSSKTWIQQSQTVEDNLQKLKPTDHTLIQVKNKLQVMVDEVYRGKQIDPQVNLAKVDPIILRQINKEKQIVNSKAKEDSKQMQIVNTIRQHNKDLKNFQIVQRWTSKVSNEKERQTILLKQTGGKESDNTEQVYQYHTVVKNVQTDQIMYIGHETMEAIVEDQQGKAIQPPTIIDLAQEKTQPKQITTIWQKTMKQIKKQIIMKVVQAKDIQKVTKKMPSKIQKQIYEWTPQLSQWQLKKLWNNNRFKTYIQYAALFQKGSQYIYVYLFQWKKNKTFSFVGNSTVKKPFINLQGQFVNPNSQSKFKNTKTAFLTNVIVQKFPQVVSHQIVSILQRIFPTVTRYTVILKSGQKKLQYIIHFYGQNAIIVEWQLLEQNLPPISKQVKVIQELVTKTLQNVKQVNQQQKRLSDCQDRKCDETQLAIQKQQMAILKLFRQKNPTLTSLQLVQTWTHQFKTFVQWTILVKITSLNKISFIYFHANQFLENNNFTFWGQTTLLQPLVGDSGKYGLSNPQENVPQPKLLQARTIINSKFPQATTLQARKTILRQFPEKRSRSLIVLRHETSKVQYIVLSDSTSSWLQETSTIETNLQKQLPSQTELKQKLQALATQILSKKPIDTEVSLQKSQQQIEITPKKVATEPTTYNMVKPVNQQFKRQDTVTSAVSGKKTQNTHTMTKDDKKIVNKIIKTYRNNKIFTSQQFLTITSVQPLTVIGQQFCQFSDYLLIYGLQQKVYVFAFRFYMTKEDNILYLGKFTFNRISGMSDQDIIDKSTAIRSSFNKDTAINTIIQMHKDLTGLTYQTMDVKQMGDYIRAVFIYPNKDYLSRYLVSVSPNGDYKVIQECRLQKSKQLHTLTKVSVTGQTSVYTNDVENILKEDKTAKEVIQNLKREISNVKDGQVVDIKVTDYDKKTQYVVNFKTDKPDISQTHHEVSVVHDKTSHSNDIIGVQVVKPQPIKPVQTQTSQSTKLENTEPTTKTIESPVQTQQTYIVIGGSKVTPSEPTQTQTISKVQNPLNAEVSSKIIKQIKNSQNIKQQDIEIKQILVKAHTEDKKVNKIQQIVQNNKTGQQILVTAIVNTQTNKVIIEDIKPIQDHIAKHLQPTHEIQPQFQPQIQEPIKIRPQQVLSILKDVQAQIIKNQEQHKACDKIAEDFQQMQKLKNQIKYRLEQNPSEPILINPSDIQSVLQQVKDQITVVDTTKVTQKFTPHVTQTKQQALNYLQTAKPQTSTAKVVQTITQVLPTSIITHIIEQTPLNTIYATIQKAQAGNNLTDFITVKNTNQKTIQTVISQVQSQDTAGYQPIDPQIMNIGKATQIIASQPNNQFQQKIDLTKPEEKIEQVVQAIRTQYPITNQATVIAASQTKISPTTSEIKVDFFVPNQNNAYKVDEAKVQISTGNNNNDPSYAVTSFSQVVNNGVQTNKVLDKADPSQLPNIINVAYGFQKIDLAVAAKNLDIQTIQAEIQRRYPNFVAGQAVTQIQSLELKNGKINYVFRYKNAYFTIYWDSVLKRIIFLNQVSTTSRTQFQAVKDMEYYTNGLSYVANIHQNQMKNYKTLTTGEYINGMNIVFQIEFLSGNRKYRSIFQVNKQTMDTTELLFTQLIELTMKDYSLKEIKLLADIYQRISSSNYKSNRYFTMVDQYAKNRNPILKNSKILGARFKPQNLGFNFKITYKTEDSRLIQTQIYIETFSQRYSQISLKLLDFENGFSSAQVPKVDMDKIIQSIASKNSIVLTTDQYNIDNAQAKQFFYGYLFKLVVTINSIQYKGLVYVDSASGQISLIRWRTKVSGTGCQIKAEESQECKKCTNGYVLSADMKTCLRQIDGCQIYGDNKLTCNICKTGFEKLNNICTKDCGLLCLAVAYP